MSRHDTDHADAEDAPDLELADPDDYHRQQRLQEIHKARQEVAEKVAELEIDGGPQAKISYESIAKLSHATAMYVNELLPLIEATDIDEEDIALPDSCWHDTAIEYAERMGIGEDGRPSNPIHSLEVYRVCNRVLADVKPLIEEDETNEWEV